VSENFPAFSRHTHARLQRMSKEEMFTVDVGDIFASYLAAFPAGSNPLYKERTEHDCSCCKQFVRSFGRTIAIIDGKRYSVWGDGAGLPHPYNEVAARMDAIIQQAPILGVFRTKERKYGAEHTVQMIDGHAHRWNHFHGVVAAKHHSMTPEADRGTLDSTGQVLRRGLTELKASAVDEVIDLIEQGALYRGDEHLRALKDFRKLQQSFGTAADPDLMVWSNLDKPAARFRNTAIGTLIQDISEGMDTERAVRVFEAKVAPANYKRPKALVTPKMVDAALKTLADLGLEDAVERRFARIGDVSVANVLFVDNAVREKMKPGLRDVLIGAAVESKKKATRAGAITMEEFVSRVVPEARAISLHLKNTHMPNFVSLTAPVHADAGRLFKWSNGFGWTYDGDVADSIKERVKRAGGNTGAALRVSLAWSNTDDLDIHARCPDGHVYFGEKKGILDVDMNVNNVVRDPVENLSWTRPRNGAYKIEVNNFNLRETKDVGFTIEVECAGRVQQFSCRTNPARGQTIDCIEFRMSNGEMTDLKVISPNHLRGGSVSGEKWGVRTEVPVRVNTLLTSPNHWDGAGEVGAKHWIFILEGCKNPDNARGIYNEFLRGDLEPHRKVFEILGAKTKCPPSDEQLSGVGFTGGRDLSVLVTVDTANGSRDYEISF